MESTYIPNYLTFEGHEQYTLEVDKYSHKVAGELFEEWSEESPILSIEA